MEVEPRIARAIVGAIREGGRSGHEIWRWLGPVHGHATILSEANLYPVLHALEAERLIEGYWREGETIRRAYRLARGGLDAAIQNGWAPIGYRRASEGGDDESGWSFAVERSQPGGAAAPAVAVAIAGATATPAAAETAPAGADAHGKRQFDGFLDELRSALRLDDLHGADAVIEIADHLADAAASLRGGGIESDDAAALAIAGLGSPEELAEGLFAAECTPRRLRAGISWGSAVATLAFLVAFALVGAAFAIATPVLQFALLAIVSIPRLDLYLSHSAAIEYTQMLLPASLAAFLAARRSITHAAVRSHRSEQAIGRIWMLAGVVPLALIGLLLPVPNDPAAIAGAIGLPAMWVAGCLRPVRLDGELVTARAAALAVGVLALGLLLPGFHWWVYHHNQLPAAAPPLAAGSQPEMVWNAVATETHATWAVYLDGIDMARWHDIRIEAWRVDRSDVSMLPDGGTMPEYAVPFGHTLDFAGVPRLASEWWVIVTATDADGTRRTLGSEIRPGYAPERTAPVLRWLLTPFLG